MRGGGGGMPGGGSGAINGGGAQQPGDGPRQLAREMQERIAEAEALRGELKQQGLDTAPLDRAIEGMRAVEKQERSGDDAHTAKDLRAQVLDGLKAYEFALRRAVEGNDGTRVMQVRPGEVPASFRAWVDEYYRSIAKQKP